MKKLLIATLVVVIFICTIIFFSNSPPKLTITTESKEIEVVQGSYCWKGLIQGECIDKISPTDLIKQHELKPTIVSFDEKIKLKFKRKPIENTLNAAIFFNNDEIEKVPLDGNILTVRKEKGIYIYSISANWEKGSSSYIFIIEVK